jgi:hypothetical protein
MRSYESLLSTEPPPAFAFIDPPFDFNSPTVSKYPPEVTGSLALKSLCRRLGWSSLADKRLLDFGCGVRFARTMVNLGMDIGLYGGVDVNADAIQWLRSHIRDDRFRFERIDMKNQLFNPRGACVGPDVLKAMGLTGFVHVLGHHASRSRGRDNDIPDAIAVRNAGGPVILHGVH